MLNDAALQFVPYISLDRYEDVVEHQPTASYKPHNRTPSNTDKKFLGVNVGDAARNYDVAGDQGPNYNRDTGMETRGRTRTVPSQTTPNVGGGQETNDHTKRRLFFTLGISILPIAAILLTVAAFRHWPPSFSEFLVPDESTTATHGGVFRSLIATAGKAVSGRTSAVGKQRRSTQVRADAEYIGARYDKPTHYTERAELVRRVETVNPFKPVVPPKPATDGRFSSICLFSSLSRSRSATSTKRSEVLEAGRECQLLLHCCASVREGSRIGFDDGGFDDAQFLFRFNTSKKLPPAKGLLVDRVEREPFLNPVTAVQFTWSVASLCVENSYNRVYLFCHSQDNIALDLIAYIKNRLSAFNILFGLVLTEDRSDLENITAILGIDALLMVKRNMSDHDTF